LFKESDAVKLNCFGALFVRRAFSDAMTSQSENIIAGEESNAVVPVLEATSDYPPEPQNFGETPVFGTLTLLFEAMQNERRQDKRRLMLEKWFQVGIPLVWDVAILT
jgi:hypothetical protein